MLQVQYSLLDRRPENGMSDFCLQQGIGILPYGVLAGGFLSDKYLGMPSSKWVFLSEQDAMFSAADALDGVPFLLQSQG